MISSANMAALPCCSPATAQHAASSYARGGAWPCMCGGLEARSCSQPLVPGLMVQPYGSVTEPHTVWHCVCTHALFLGVALLGVLQPLPPPAIQAALMHVGMFE